MKRLILNLILLVAMLLEFSNASIVTNSYWTGSGTERHKVSTVECGNSKVIFIGYYPNNTGAQYFSGDGGIYFSWDEAVSKSCYNDKNKVYIRKGGLVCKNRKSIQHALESNVYYVIERVGSKGCFTINKRIKVKILKSYGKETFMELYDEKKPRRKAVRIDTYLKISDTYDTYYVRSADLE